MRNLIAILRGVKPNEVVAIASALIGAGISRIEVPLNSPDPLKSISAMAHELKGLGAFGAGTVLNQRQVGEVKLAGGSFIVSPDCNPAVISATKAEGLGSYPGVFTASECFSALRSGADALKLFPASLAGPEGLKALRAVLPSGTPVYAVGGAGSGNFKEWIDAGANGFGLGGSLYKPGMDASEVAGLAAATVAAFDRATNTH
jgi:2-dehydro-3-deoxyphosphogalactonate aldolase